MACCHSVPPYGVLRTTVLSEGLPAAGEVGEVWRNDQWDEQETAPQHGDLMIRSPAPAEVAHLGVAARRRKCCSFATRLSSLHFLNPSTSVSSMTLDKEEIQVACRPKIAG